MGAFAGVAQGSDEEPRLITLRYDGPGATGPVLGFVGKAVTFDSGGISIKPGNKMSDMKFDMSGGAAVLGATAAIARLGLPVRLVSVIGATENLPSGHSMKPGDILRARNGTTIEVINTDAEGRLVLADCLAHAVEQGAERLVDLATLTGAIVTTLGTTYAGLMGQDDEWCEEVSAAGRRAGEIVWRLPLHAEYAELIKGRYGDILNAVENRRAALGHRRGVPAPLRRRRAVGASGHRRHGAGTPARPTRPRAASGYGVRLLVALASATGGVAAGAESEWPDGLRPLADHELIRRTVRDFAEGEVAPVAEALDHEKRFPYEIVDKLGELGLMGIPFPEEYGGAGGDTLAYAIAVEELTRVDSSVAITMCAHTSLGTQPIYLFGTEEQKQEWLPDLTAGRKLGAFGLTEPEAGSDAGNVRTRARRDNGDWVIDGAKQFITNAGTDISGVVCITARTGERGDLQPDRARTGRRATSRASRTARWAGTRRTRGR